MIIVSQLSHHDDDDDDDEEEEEEEEHREDEGKKEDHIHQKKTNQGVSYQALTRRLPGRNRAAPNWDHPGS